MTYSTANFTYDPETATFTADASDLGFRGENRITVKSHRTDREVEFACQRPVRDGEGELAGWLYAPVHVGLRSRGITLVIAND